MSQATASRQGQARDPSAAQLAVAPVGPFPSRLAVGRGQAFFVDGTCSHPTRRIQSLQVRLGDRSPAGDRLGHAPARRDDRQRLLVGDRDGAADGRAAHRVDRARRDARRRQPRRPPALGTIDLVPDLEGPVGVSGNGQPAPIGRAGEARAERPCGRLHGHLRPPDRALSAPDRLDPRADAPQLGLPDQRRRLEPRQARGDAGGPRRRSTPAAVGWPNAGGLLPQLRAGARAWSRAGADYVALSRPGRPWHPDKLASLLAGLGGRPARLQRHADRRRGRRGDLRHLLELQAEQSHRFRRARDGQYRDRRGACCSTARS